MSSKHAPKTARKIAINCCYGGFSLSKEASELLGLDNGYGYYDGPRDAPGLIKVIKKLGPENAGGKFARIKIVEIPADVEWQIDEYDGIEWVAEKHRTWS